MAEKNGFSWSPLLSFEHTQTTPKGGKTLSLAECPMIFVMGMWGVWELGWGIALAKAQYLDCFLKSYFPLCSDPVQLLGNHVRCMYEKCPVKAEVMQRNFLVIKQLAPFSDVIEMTFYF